QMLGFDISSDPRIQYPLSFILLFTEQTAQSEQLFPRHKERARFCAAKNRLILEQDTRHHALFVDVLIADYRLEDTMFGPKLPKVPEVKHRLGTSVHVVRSARVTIRAVLV